MTAVAKRMPITDRDRERFSKYVAPGPKPSFNPTLGPCRLFTGSRKTERGYGQFQWGGYKAPNRSAHAFAWESVHGPIPPGMTIDHLCRVTACVRVEHLEMVTQQENYRRAREAATHCRNGHPYNRGVVGTGKIRCEICWVANRTRNEAARAARARAARQPRELMPIPHGTANGYDAHNRRDIPIPEGDPCGCRAAHNARARMHKRNRRLRQLAAERAA